MGMTRKPCPGCGKTSDEYGGIPFRETGSVCEGCKRKLREADEYRELQKNKKEKMMLVAATERGISHYWPSYYGLGPMNHSGYDHARDNLRDAMRLLTLELIEPALESIYNYSERTEAPRVYRDIRLSKCKRGCGDHWDGRELYFIHPMQHQRINELDHAICDAIRAAYFSGKADGQNFLMNIASGEISMQEMNKASITGMTNIEFSYDKLEIAE